MATFNRTGGFASDGSWNTTTNWTPNTVPVDTDEVVLIGSTNDITAGLDQSLIALNKFQISDGWTKKIGASGGPLRIDATTANFYSAGSECWIDGTYTDMFIDSGTRSTNAFQLNTGATAKTITRLHALRGRVTCGGNCTVTTLNVGGPRASQAFVDLATSSTATTVKQTGGTVTHAGTTTTYDMSGGICECNTGATVTTLNIYSGSYVFNAGETTNINLYGGVVDFTQGTAQKTCDFLNVYGGEYRIHEQANLAGDMAMTFYTTGAHGFQAGQVVTVSGA